MHSGIPPEFTAYLPPPPASSTAVTGGLCNIKVAMLLGFQVQAVPSRPRLVKGSMN